MKKKCPKCKTDKELNTTNFYKSNCNADGFAHECKDCIRERGRRYKTRAQKDNEHLNMWI